MNDITRPLILSAGSHDAGTGRGCAMNVISWENGDTVITDYPACSDYMLAGLVQRANDSLAEKSRNWTLSPENSIVALDLGHATVGTAVELDLGRRRAVYHESVLAGLRLLQPLWPLGRRSQVMGELTVMSGDMMLKLDTVDALACHAVNVVEDALLEVVLVPYGQLQFLRAKTAQAVIDRFKELTGTTSPTPDPQVTAHAVQNMLAVS